MCGYGDEKDLDKNRAGRRRITALSRRERRDSSEEEDYDFLDSEDDRAGRGDGGSDGKGTNSQLRSRPSQQRPRLATRVRNDTSAATSHNRQSNSRASTSGPTSSYLRLHNSDREATDDDEDWEFINRNSDDDDKKDNNLDLDPINDDENYNEHFDGLPES